jgi:hypothetical protein
VTIENRQITINRSHRRAGSEFSPGRAELAARAAIAMSRRVPPQEDEDARAKSRAIRASRWFVALQLAAQAWCLVAPTRTATRRDDGRLSPTGRPPFSRKPSNMTGDRLDLATASLRRRLVEVVDRAATGRISIKGDTR